EMFGLVLPEKVAEAVVTKDVRTIFDPVTKELIQIDMPLYTASEHTRLKLKDGWITEASVEDVKLLPGVNRTIFRLEGGDWVARGIVNDVQSGGAEFVINSGDVVWWGNQGRTVNESPYWKMGERYDVKAASASGSRDASGWAGGSVVHERGQSRGLG